MSDTRQGIYGKIKTTEKSGRQVIIQTRKRQAITLASVTQTCSRTLKSDGFKGEPLLGLDSKLLALDSMTTSPIGNERANGVFSSLIIDITVLPSLNIGKKSGSCILPKSSTIWRNEGLLSGLSDQHVSIKDRRGTGQSRGTWSRWMTGLEWILLQPVGFLFFCTEPTLLHFFVHFEFFHSHSGDHLTALASMWY